MTRTVRNRGILLVVLLAQALFAGGARAELALAGLFGDNMVLQRGERTAVWGRGDPGQTVVVYLDSLAPAVTVGQDGTWRLFLDTTGLPPGPHKVHVQQRDGWVTFDNVLVGDVWVASGQSNMEWPVAAAANAEAEVAAADFPLIRHYTVPKRISTVPLDGVDGQWEVCSPATVGRFTAVGYYFAREVHRATGAPIGVVHTSWGGTPAEAWTSDAALTAHLPETAPRIAARDAAAQDADAEARYRAALAEWEAKHRPTDSTTTGVDGGWHQPDADVSGWSTMEVPRLWERAGLPIDGAVWFRRDVDVPADWAGRDLSLSLGPIDDFDVTFFNGQQVGQTDRTVADYWRTPRVYTVPGHLVRPGRNVLAVRVFDHGGGGGLYGEPGQLALKPADGADEVGLGGEWRYKVEREIEPPSPEAQATRPEPPQYNQNSPGVLYNAMIHPLLGYGIRGAIWYQGESNAWRAHRYRDLMPAMIADWRARFGQGDFPFYLVQLANFMPRKPEPGDSAWAELREAQRSTALRTPNVGMAVAIDVGDPDDIHPRNKQEVGRRLGLLALRDTYGTDVVASGPSYESAAVEGDRVRVRFSHAEGGLKTTDGRPPVGFAVAGEDRQFAWAEAAIDGDSIVVHSPGVPAPVAVRYGWADNPDVNLVNGAGLPASPFRTDDWHGVTMNNR